MDRGAWRAMVHRVTKTQTRLKQLSTQACRGRRWQGEWGAYRYSNLQLFVGRGEVRQKFNEIFKPNNNKLGENPPLKCDISTTMLSNNYFLK